MSRLLGGEAGGGELENRLLREFFEGYPIEKLRLLLESKSAEVIAAGVWIASELGSVAKPLFRDVVDLINYPVVKVRFFALDYLGACAQVGDEWAIGLALDLLDDADSAVRWKAMTFLTCVPEPVLRSTLDRLHDNEQSRLRRIGLSLLTRTNSARDGLTIADALAGDEPVLRRYAAAAAARMVTQDPHLLKLAMESADPTIKQFAVDMAARAGISSRAN